MWQYLPLGGNSGLVQAGLPLEPPPLSLPKVWEWRISLEKSFEGRSTLSLAYTGSAGRKLLRLDATVDPATEVLEGTYFTSYGTSHYEALEAQFTGNQAQICTR
ncbi:MAG: hypothetical protein WB992_16965 [Bryobacteraceae bacterium]